MVQTDLPASQQGEATPTPEAVDLSQSGISHPPQGSRSAIQRFRRPRETLSGIPDMWGEMASQCGQERELADRAEDQRREEFIEAYRSLYPAICGYALRRTANPQDAADVVADTFLTFWRRFDDAPSGDEMRPWLYGIARRILANLHRSERRRTALADRLVGDFQMIDLQVEAHGTEIDADSPTARAFALLSETDRELLSLVAWENLSHEELSVVLVVSRPVVRLRLHRARRRLGELLQHQTEPQASMIAGTVQRPPGLGPSPRKEHHDIS